MEDRYRLNWINNHLGDPTLSAITDTVIASLIRSKRDEGASPGTLQRYIGLIHTVLNGAKRAGWLAAVPAMPDIMTPPGRVRWLNQREWQRLEPLLPPHLRQLARFTLATGLRRHIRWEQVHPGRRALWISADDMKQEDALGVPLNDDAVAVLEEQQGVHAVWVFPYNGKPVHLTSTKAWHLALTTAGIERFTWHDLRHTWASWHGMKGTRLEELQVLGGWKTREMVQRYAHLAPQHLARVASNVRPVDHAHS